MRTGCDFSLTVCSPLITILVLDLKPPHADAFGALLPLWPTGLAYAVSYVFIAIVWVNHHHLFGYAESATPRLVWSNVAHLFSVSLIPFCHRVDCRYQAGRGPGRAVCRHICPRQRHLPRPLL